MWILIPILFSFVFIGILIIVEAWEKRKCWKQIYRNELLPRKELHLYDKKYRNKVYVGLAVNAAQLSFNRFLSLYAISPEKWIITTDEYSDNHNFAYYVGKDKIIPVYWESPKELKKYYNWVEKEFEKGSSALYDQARERAMKDLTECLQADIQERAKQTEKEIQIYEENIKKHLEKLNEKKEIKLTLNP